MQKPGINYPDLEPGNEFWNRVRVRGSCYKSLVLTKLPVKCLHTRCDEIPHRTQRTFASGQTPRTDQGDHGVVPTPRVGVRVRVMVRCVSASHSFARCGVSSLIYFNSMVAVFAAKAI